MKAQIIFTCSVLIHHNCLWCGVKKTQAGMVLFSQGQSSWTEAPLYSDSSTSYSQWKPDSGPDRAPGNSCVVCNGKSLLQLIRLHVWGPLFPQLYLRLWVSLILVSNNHNWERETESERERKHIGACIMIHNGYDTSWELIHTLEFLFLISPPFTLK